MTEKLFIIGSNSFSGSWLVNHSLEQGFEVMGVSRSREPDSVFLAYKWSGTNRFKFFQADLNHDQNKIAELINEFKPGYIINFAAQSMVGQSWDIPEHWYQTNVLSSVRLMEKIRQFSFLKKYIHVSTPEVYGGCEGLVREHTSYMPSTPYAVSRAAFDMHLMALKQAYDFPVVFTRAANVFGPGQQLYRVIPRAALCFLKGEKLPLHGGGRSVRSFIHILDVCRATLMIAEKADSGQIFHISTKQMISIHDLVAMVAGQMGVDFENSVKITDDRLGKDAAYLLDSSRIRELGWEERFTLDQGISHTIDWVKTNFDKLKNLPDYYIHKP